MAENPSDGHASNGSHTFPENGVENAPGMPRVAAPAGVRSARAYDGSPVEIEEPPAEITSESVTSETKSYNNALDNEEPSAEITSESVTPESQSYNNALDNRDFAADYRADLEDSFPDAAPSAPLNIDISTDETNGFGAFAPDDYAGGERGDYGAEATGADTIEGEQLFADDGAGGDGGAPPTDNTALATGGGGRPDTPRDQEAGLFEHLTELRSRLLYSVIGVMAVMCLTWNYALPIQGWFSAPITRVLHAHGGRGELISTDPTAFFTLQFQSSLLAALLLAAPWVLFQVWRFVEPALTNSERRYTLVLVPFSSILFFLGAALGYVCSPLFFQFFLQFQPPGVAAQWKYDDSVILMAKMLLIFGLAFQVPIVIIFGNKIGLVSRNLLIEYWRHAVVVIFIVVAVLTPTWDPFTMTACALPPCLLYLLSIWLVKWL